MTTTSPLHLGSPLYVCRRSLHLHMLNFYTMPSLASFTDPKSYHIISYGTLLGSTLFQSFIAGPFAYSAIPRPQFATLQQKIVPTYFAFQTALPVVLALTWPGANVRGTVLRNDTGWRGVLDSSNFWDALVPIGVMFGTGLLNMVLLGPATTKVMRERKHQGTSTRCNLL